MKKFFSYITFINLVNQKVADMCENSNIDVSNFYINEHIIVESS